jgi:hypothetical protein
VAYLSLMETPSQSSSTLRVKDAPMVGWPMYGLCLAGALLIIANVIGGVARYAIVSSAYVLAAISFLTFAIGALIYIFADKPTGTTEKQPKA